MTTSHDSDSDDITTAADVRASVESLQPEANITAELSDTDNSALHDVTATTSVDSVPELSAVDDSIVSEM